MKKEALALDGWLQDVAPSAEWWESRRSSSTVALQRAGHRAQQCGGAEAVPGKVTHPESPVPRFILLRLRIDYRFSAEV
jgi:hypothetical protein